MEDTQSQHDQLYATVLRAIRTFVPDWKSYERTSFEVIVASICPDLTSVAYADIGQRIRSALGDERNWGGYFYGRNVSVFERNKRVNDLARIVMNAVGEGAACGATPNTSEIELQFKGPFGLVRESGLPLAQEQPVARQQGIYLWTVELGDGYAINYAGKTGGEGSRCFARRFAEELEYERGRGARYWDIDAFRRGERLPIFPQDTLEQRANVEVILSLYRIFMAPIVVSSDVLGEIEKGVIRHIQDSDERCRKFLANAKANPKGLPLELSISSDVRLIGLASRNI